MKKRLLNQKSVAQWLYSIGLLLLFANLGYCQQVIGSYPNMNGGFEGPDTGLTFTNNNISAATTTWTKNSNTAATISKETTTPRTGVNYVKMVQTGTATRRIQSPTSVMRTEDVGKFFRVQFYYKGDLDGTPTGSTIDASATVQPSLRNSILLTSENRIGWFLYEGIIATQNAYNSLLYATINVTNTATFEFDDFAIYPVSTNNEVADGTAPSAATAAVTPVSGTTVSWTAASGGVDGGGYMVVRYASNPNADQDPNVKGIYAKGLTITNGTNGVSNPGTVVYIGTGTSFTDDVAGSSSGTDYYKIYTVDKAFNYSAELIATAVVSSTPAITCSTETLTGFNYAGVGPSTSQSFLVSGSNLTSNLVVSTASTTDFELSADNFATAGASSISLPSPTVSSTTISVRLKANLIGGVKTATVTIASTGANTLPTLSLSGSATNVFYYNGSGALSDTSSWGANVSGSGANPTAVTETYTNFVIANGNATTNATWTLGSNSKVIVGNGSAVTLTVADTFPIIGTIDAAANGSIYWKHVLASPTFGILHSNSEVHLQPTTPAIGLTSVSYVIPGTSFGKLFIDGAAPINLSNGHTVNTLLSVAEGSQLILPTQSSHYIYINTGASATINGTVRSIKKTGILSFNISTPNGNTGIQFKDSGSTLTLSATSTIDYSSINGPQTISALPSGSSYANLTLSENSTNITSSSIKAFPTLTITGTLTINTPGNPSWPSSTTGAGSITLGDGATIVRTIGTLNEAPTFGSSVNVNYNGNGATQMVGSTTLNSSNVTLTTSNAAIAVGNTVTGIGVPEGTTVASISGTALVLSQNATATANNVTFTIGTAVPQTTGFELPTATSVLNNLNINNPAGVTLGGNVSVNGTLTFTSGNLAIGSNTLTLNGSVVNTSGTLTGSSTSNLTIGGAAGTLNFTSGSRALNNLSLGASGSTTLGTALDIYGTVGFTAGGSLNMNAQAVTLKSTNTATARVSDLTGSTLSNATNVTVERYIPAKRAWRALTAPVSNTSTIFTNWQEGGNGSGTNGIEIWAPTAGIGLTTGGISNSLLSYNSTGNSWSGISATNATDGTSSMMNGNKNKPFMAFVIGPYGSTTTNNISSSLATETTLRATGSLFTGNQTYSSGAGEYTFIGNPYASPLNLKSMLDDSENDAFDNTIWIWQAIGAGNVGVYNTFDPAGTGIYTNVTNPNGIDATTQIQSGQAFFVKSTAAGTFTIKESHKGNTNIAANIVFRDAAPAQLLRVGLYKQENNEWSGRDGAMTVILPDANANQSPNKMANGTENVAFTKNSGLFASNHHLPLVASDVLNVRVWRTTAGANYKLKINTEDFVTTNLSATLEDLFTNSRTPLNLEGAAVEYPFTVTNDALSTGDRFRIVFQNAVLGTNTPTATSFSIVPNPVTGDTFQVNLGTLATGIYSYSICNAIGQEVEKGILNNATQNTNYEVKISNSATGIYIMKIKGNDNTVFTAKIIKK
jgi:hypothetical protein